MSRARQPGSGERAELPSHCLDCGEPLRGAFCSRCGQEARPLDFSLRRVLRETLDDLFSLDSRGWATVRRLVTRPGFLTLEHWHGRHARWVPPVRLYVLISFVAFLILTPLGRFEQARADDDVDSGLFEVGIQNGTPEEIEEAVLSLEEAAESSSPTVEWWIERVAIPVVRDIPAAQEAYSRRLPAIGFALVPVLALELLLLFRRRVRTFVQHLITALHLQSFFYLALITTSLLSLVTGETLADALLLLASAVYGYRTLRTVYWEQSRVALLLKIPLLAVAHVMLLLAALTATFVVVGLSL